MRQMSQKTNQAHRIEIPMSLSICNAGLSVRVVVPGLSARKQQCLRI
jgi:hypothetical protein